MAALCPTHARVRLKLLDRLSDQLIVRGRQLHKVAVGGQTCAYLSLKSHPSMAGEQRGDSTPPHLGWNVRRWLCRRARSPASDRAAQMSANCGSASGSNVPILHQHGEHHVAGCMQQRGGHHCTLGQAKPTRERLLS